MRCGKVRASWMPELALSSLGGKYTCIMTSDTQAKHKLSEFQNQAFVHVAVDNTRLELYYSTWGHVDDEVLQLSPVGAQ